MFDPTVAAAGEVMVATLPGAVFTLTLPVVKERNRFVSVDPLPNVVELPLPFDDELLLDDVLALELVATRFAAGPPPPPPPPQAVRSNTLMPTAAKADAEFVYMVSPPNPVTVFAGLEAERFHRRLVLSTEGETCLNRSLLPNMVNSGVARRAIILDAFSTGD